MAFYYVKAGGTASGDSGRYASQQTGTFASIGASGYYDTIALALGATTAPTDGDFICVSDSHAKTGLSSQTYSTGSALATNEPVYIVSVSDSNCDQYSAGASEEATNFYLYGELSFKGITLDGGSIWGYTDVNLMFEDCTLKPSSGLRNGGSNCNWLLINTDVISDDSTVFQNYANGTSSIKMIGGSVSKLTGNLTSLIDDNYSYSGNHEFVGVDMGNLSSAYILSGNQYTDRPGAINIRIDKCKMGSLTGYLEDQITGLNGTLLVTNSSSSSSAAEYQYYVEARNGSAEDDTAFYRDDSVAFPDSAQKVSLKVITEAEANVMNPFHFQIPARYAELSAGASDTIRIYLLSATTLTDIDVWAEVIYRDGTNKQTPNVALSNVAEFDPFDSGTTLTSNTDTWTGRTTENRYQIDIDTSGDAGADQVAELIIYVAKPSTTIYFDSSVGLV